MAYKHQDWNPIVLKSTSKKTKQPKQNNPIKTTETKYNAGKNSQQQQVNSKSIEKKIEDNEDLHIHTVSRSMQLQIQQARQHKGMSQKQLAFACNLTENLIKDYENGKEIPKSQDITKMNKALGTVLKN